jgi:hypothetical protein
MKGELMTELDNEMGINNPQLMNDLQNPNAM